MPVPIISTYSINPPYRIYAVDDQMIFLKGETILYPAQAGPDKPIKKNCFSYAL